MKMKNMLLWGAGWIFLSVTSVAFAGYQWEYYGGHWYALTLDYGTWEECEAEAVAIGWHLTNINDQAENDWLAETFKHANTQGPTDNNIAWIGLRGSIGDGSLYWVCGDEVTYANPTPIRLSDGDFWYLHGNNHAEAGYWNANPVHNTQPDQYPMGIIETPEPATLSLFALAGLALLRRRSGQVRR